METSLFILFFFLCLKIAQAKGSKYDGKKRTMKMEEMYKYKEKKRTKSEMSTQKGKKKKNQRRNGQQRNGQKQKEEKEKKLVGWGKDNFFHNTPLPPFLLHFLPNLGD